MTEATTLRKCIGSMRYGIEPHEAPVGYFPAQPSQKDGLGRMCKVHWNWYTAGLARDAKANKAGEPSADVAAPATEPTAKPSPKPKAAANRTGKPIRKAREDAASVAHNAMVKAEAEASTPDFEAAAEQDAILVERRARVTAWRKGEVEGTAAEA